LITVAQKGFGYHVIWEKGIELAHKYTVKFSTTRWHASNHCIKIVIS
jgi:hypothetical protein